MTLELDAPPVSGGDPPSMLEAALHYAEDFGWPVFPCGGDDGKKPLTAHGFLDATTNPDQIRRWWEQYPDASIGVPCGHHFWVLDVDGPTGEQSLSELQGNEALFTTRVKTGRGSHFYFFGAGPPTAIGIRPGLDVRALGSYVIVPPSLHYSGVRYVWVVWPDEMNEAPLWLVEALGRDAAAPNRHMGDQTPAVTRKLSESKRADLERALAVIAADDYGVWVKVGMGLHSTDAGDEAFRIWVEWSSKSSKFKGEDDCWTHWRSFGKREREVTVATIFHFAKEQAQSNESVPPLADNQTPLLGPVSPIERLWESMPIEWVAQAPPSRKYLLLNPDGTGFMPLGKVNVFSAEGGVGKTKACFQLAVSVATGRPWLNYFKVEESGPRRVLLILGEEDREEAWRRIWEICEVLELDDRERRLVLQTVVILPLASELCPFLEESREGKISRTPHREALDKMLQRHAHQIHALGAPLGGWALVIVDPLARMAGIDAESDNTYATRLIQEMESVTRAPGSPAVIVVSHSSKTARRSGKADARGVTGLTDGARSAWTMRHDEDNSNDVIFEVTKSNYSARSNELQLKRRNYGILMAETEEERATRLKKTASAPVEEALIKSTTKDEVAEARRRRLLPRVLEEVRKKPGIGRKGLIAAVGGNKSNAEQGIDAAIAWKEIVLNVEGNKHYHYLPDDAPDDESSPSSPHSSERKNPPVPPLPGDGDGPGWTSVPGVGVGDVPDGDGGRGTSHLKLVKADEQVQS